MACEREQLGVLKVWESEALEPIASNPNHLQTILSAPSVKGKGVMPLPKDGLMDLVQSIIFKNQELKEPFYVLDLGAVASLMDKWTRNLPNVCPFYAVKCNPEPAVLEAMESLGAGFDCASQAEIETVLSFGVSPNRIIYANPCKAKSHIKYAASVGVNLTTFDSKEEVEKIRKYHPECVLLLRIKVDDTGARRPLSMKFGALPEEIEQLLLAARAAELTVGGVSFHVGSGATDSHTYRAAIAASKTVFDVVTRLGMPHMRFLNIGGGFTAGPQFEDAATTVESAVQEYFQSELGLTIIAEPGRFFAETPFTLATTIIGKRVRGELREYWINDGVFGSPSPLPHGYESVYPTPLACTSNVGNPMCRGERTYHSTVFGPTCAADDMVVKGQLLPELEVDDWLVFENMGAYRIALGSNFNGFNSSAIKTYLTYSNHA